MKDDMTWADAFEVAYAAVYLSIGFEDACRADTSGIRYGAWGGVARGGHLGCVHRLVGLARVQEQWLQDAGKTDFPGVFAYEFTEPLGGWLYANGDPTDAEFIAELERRWGEWTKEAS